MGVDYSKWFRFEVPMAVTMKNTVLWVINPCRSGKPRCFGAIYRLHLQDRRISQARNQQKVESCAGLVSGLLFDPKMEATYSTGVIDFLLLTRRYNPKIILFINNTWFCNAGIAHLLALSFHSRS
jgi:hypothetical protein